MANIYIDLEAAGTGHAGTLGDPWSYLDLQAASVTPTSDTFLIRGSIDLGANAFYGPQGAYYNAWDTPTYGPWRVKAANMYSSYPATDHFTGGTVRDAILELGPTNFNPFGYYYNVYLKLNQYYDAGNNATFSGCYIDVSLDFLPGNGVFRDCCIKAATWSLDAYSPTIYNCAMTGTNGGYTLNDCQTDWVAPTAPAWDAPQSSFYTAILFAGVSTPPQPGSPPYTNYTTDLWGNARTGIGTGLMLPLPTTTTTTAAPTTTTPAPTYRPAPFASPDGNVGMPPKAGNTVGNLQHSDTKFGSSRGNLNDNSSGENKADGTENGGPVKTVRGGGGGILGISSKPSWLSN